MSNSNTNPDSNQPVSLYCTLSHPPGPVPPFLEEFFKPSTFYTNLTTHAVIQTDELKNCPFVIVVRQVTKEDPNSFVNPDVHCYVLNSNLETSPSPFRAWRSTYSANTLRQLELNGFNKRDGTWVWDCRKLFQDGKEKFLMLSAEIYKNEDDGDGPSMCAAS